MKPILRSAVALVAAAVLAGMVPAGAHAFQMIQNTSVGRFTFGAAVPCTAPGGFAHWGVAGIPWRYNPANQGGKAGTAAALQNAMASWNSVSGASHTLSLLGTSGAGFVTDGVNVVSWGTGQGCSGGCLALTAIVLQAGQVLVETDVTFNDAFVWNTNGGDYDVEAIAAHEFGHSLGIHHTDKNTGSPRKRPTMYSQYFGINGRSLEEDDRAALQCAQSRYPPAGAFTTAVESDVERSARGSVALSARPRPGGALIRFALAEPADVRMEVFDVAGRAIATLAEGWRDAGEYQVAWNGESRFDRARSGVYFARIRAGGTEAHATVILFE